MKDWPTEDQADAERRANPWWRDRWNDLDAKHQLRDDFLVAAVALFYLGKMPRPRKPASPFRYFNSSPEVIASW